MKAQIFKIAGVKNDKEFYDKFPTEESFIAKHGAEFKAWQMAQGGGAFTSFDPSSFLEDGGAKAFGLAGDIVTGIQGIREQKNQMKKAKQSMKLSDLGRQVAGLDPEQEERNYVRPEDIRNTGEEFFPIYGVGTNMLKNGGAVKAQAGFAWGAAGDAAENVMDTFWTPTAGGELGGTLGQAAGSLFGPAGAAIGQVAGKALGNLVDTDAKKLAKYQSATDRNYSAIGAMNMGNDFRQTNSAFMQDGGYAYQGGGDIKTHWGGKTELESFNPYSGGETVKFSGNMHNRSNVPGESGIGISYNGKPVEVEGGEYASIMQDGGQEEKMVVWGDLNVPKSLIPEAGGKKFKNYAADLAKKENYRTKKLAKNRQMANDLEIRTSFDKLTRNSLLANQLGHTEHLKMIDQKKQDAAAAQRAINETADELGVKAKDLSKGRLVKDDGSFTPTSSAQYGKTLPKYQGGDEEWKTIPGTEITAPGSQRTNWGSEAFQREFAAARSAGKDKFWWDGEWKSTKLASDTSARRDATPELKYYDPKLELEPVTGTPMETSLDEGRLQANTRDIMSRPARTQFKKRPDWEGIGENAVNLANSLLPQFRPSDQSDFDYDQLTGELFSLATNKVEPVDAQGFRPQLDVPYDISLQEQRNEITSATRAAQRMAGNNAPAQAIIAAQAYNAKNKINAEEFRMNQAKQDQVFSANRATMNDAQLKNLAIYDKQYERQSQARSNTRAEKLAALSSMGDKFAKHKLENKTLAAYENLYNYRFGDNMRLQNMNPLAMFDLSLKPGTAPTTTETTTIAKYGANIAKAFRGY